MSPIGELRAAIPRAIVSFDATWYEAYGWAVLGNLIPVVPLLWLLDPMARLLESVPGPGARLLQWRARRLRETQARFIERWGYWALAGFVAVPLPLTGAWTGCLLAWAFGMRRWPAFLAIAGGVVVAGAIVTSLVELAVGFPFLDS